MLSSELRGRDASWEALVTVGIEFRLLGELAVCRGLTQVTIPAGKQRVLLAALLLNANRFVPAGELAAVLWGTAIPPSAEVSLRNHVRRGQLTQAAGFYEQALTIRRRIGHPTGVPTELGNLGEVSLRQGKHRQAISYLRQALTLYRQTGYKHGETLTLRSLAEALHEAGRPAAARAALATALRLAAETGNTYQQACAHRELAESHHRTGQDEQARHHWQQALNLYAELGAPEADQIRGQLTSSS